MPIGGSAATWNENEPEDTDLVGLGASEIRSTKTNLRGALDSEHVFSSTGGSNQGVHRKGSAVAFYDTNSRISSTDTNGRLMVTSDTSQLRHTGSDNTMFLGSRFVTEFSTSGVSVQGTATASKVTQIFRMEAGQFLFPNASTGTTINLRNAYIAGTIIAVVSHAYDGSNATVGGFPVPQPSGTSQLIVYNYTAAGVGSASSSSYPVNYVVYGIAGV